MNKKNEELKISKTNDISGIESLEFLMKTNNISLKTLREITGMSIDDAVDIFEGERPLTRTHKNKLAKYFGIDAKFFD